MSVTVQIPTPLRRFTGETGEIAVEASTVSGALERLVAEHPDLRPHLFTEDGTLRSFVNVFKGEDNVRDLDGDPAVEDGDVLTIIPSIAGGSGDPGATEGDGFDLLAGRDLPDLTDPEIRRYSRHLIMPEVSRAGQRRLKGSKVLMIGAGGLGSPLGLYLAAAGVGTLGLVDYDVVDESNLHRQVLYGASDVGRPKLEAASERLGEVNPHVDVVTHPVQLTSANALELFEGYDVIVDGTDNFPTRYLVNDACVLLGKPNVYGSIFRFEGQVAVFWAAEGPCYRCLFPEPPPPGLVPSCAEGGVLGVLPGIIGALQANEVIKLLLGEGEPLIGRLLTFDALRMRFRELRLKRRADCPVCADEPTQTELIDYEQFCGMPAVEGTPEPARAEATNGDGELPFEITVEELVAWREAGQSFRLIDVRNPPEWQICRIDGADLLPLPELPRRFEDELDTADLHVVHCHHGARSAQAVQFLRGQGYRAVNLGGGIDAWSQVVDPSVPRY